MKRSWKIAISVLCLTVICGAAITWQVHERKLKEAARVCRASAEQGDAKAQSKLGSMYFYGSGVPKDYAEALRWFRKAADQGDASGQNSLGYSYLYRFGVERDYAEALRCFQKAADQGYAKAQLNLGNMYYHGYGVTQDNAEAARWYRKAAEQGMARAQYDIGYMYYYGYGVPKDSAEADRWYQKAAAQGDEYAQRALGLKGQKLNKLGIFSKSAMVLGCLLLLIGSLSPEGKQINRNHRAVILAGILGLAVEGLSLIWIFGSFPSIAAVNAFFFFKGLLAGVFVAMIISIFVPRSAKSALRVFGILYTFLTISLLFGLHYSNDATSIPALSPIRALCTLNGMFLGTSIYLAIFLWRRKKNPDGDDPIESVDAPSEAPAENESES